MHNKKKLPLLFIPHLVHQKQKYFPTFSHHRKKLMIFFIKKLHILQKRVHINPYKP